MAAFFSTDGYSSRIYAYEPGLLYNLSYPSFWNKGLHGMLMVNCELASWLTAIAKVSNTTTFATGDKTSSSKTLIEAQLQVRL